MATPAPAGAAFGFGTPFAAQIEHLRHKLNLPTEKWDDITGRAHDRAFVVAGAAKADLLADLHAAVLKRATDGAGLNAFRKDFKALVAKNGWTGWTGEGTREGEAWRTRVIYQTNMATSYAAGRWAQMTDPEVVKLHPYWRYIHSDGVLSPRENHLAWHGLTLPWDHPFWKTHFAPNGFGCQCRITSVTRKEGEASERAGLGEPPAGWDKIDPATGEQQGIGKGFGYTPGASVRKPMQEFIDEKLIKMDAPIGAAMWEVLKPVLGMERQLAWWETLDKWIASPVSQARVAVVGTLNPTTIQWLEDNAKPVPVSAEIGVMDTLPMGKKQARHENVNNAPSPDEWRNLTAMLDKPGAIYFDTVSSKLMFVADGIGPVKLALEFDPKKMKKAGINLIKSAFRVSAATIAGQVKGGEWQVVEVSGTPDGSRTHIYGK